MEVSSVKRVGYWLTEKRCKRLKFEAFEAMCRASGIDIVKLTFDRPLEEQGQFGVILHKVSDFLASDSSLLAMKHVQLLQNYAAAHPEVKMIDPVDNVLTLLDRYQQYQQVKDCDIIGHDSQYFIPPFVVFTSSDIEENTRLMAEHGIEYPIVCKPSVSRCHGVQRIPPEVDREEMVIIFNDAGMGDVQPPCVAQSFINHNARLFKIFVVGSHSYVIRRPSIKNFYAGDHQTIHFDSNDISKSHSSSPLNKMDETEIEFPIIEPDEEKMRLLVSVMLKKCQVDLLGIDVIIENKTGRYGVIDINPFPGYDGVEDFFPALLELVQLKLSDTVPVVKHQSNNSAALCEAVSSSFHQSSENGSVFKIIQPEMCQADVHVAALHTIAPVLRQGSENGSHVTNNHGVCKRCCEAMTHSFDKWPHLKCHHFTGEYLKPTSCRHVRHRLSDGTIRDKHVVVVDCVAR